LKLSAQFRRANDHIIVIIIIGMIGQVGEYSTRDRMAAKNIMYR